jgi:Tfp pilus assembly protein PilV
MVALLVASLLGASMMKTAHVSHQQIQREIQHSQAELLAEAGLARAMAKRAVSAEYSTEKWTISARELNGAHSAAVLISFTETSIPEPKTILTAMAEYPVGSATPIRVTRRVVVPLNRPQPN